MNTRVNYSAIVATSLAENLTISFHHGYLGVFELFRDFKSRCQTHNTGPDNHNF